jgi:hypothetical protein
MMQGYGTAAPRIGAVKGETLKTAKPVTGLVGKAMGNNPVRQDPSRISVKSHTRAKSSKSKSR